MPPTNTTCATAMTLGVAPTALSPIDTTGVGQDMSVPDTDCGSGNSYGALWYTFMTDGATNRLNIDLEETDPDQQGVVTLFTGSCGSLTFVACAYSGGQILPLTPSTTYLALLTSIDNSAVIGTLQMAYPLPEGDVCIEVSTATRTRAIRRLRQGPFIANEQQWLRHAKAQFDMETGIGNTMASDPTVHIQWSDDWGHTWVSGTTASAGTAGTYDTRVILNQLGRSRGRVYRVWVDEANAWRLIDGYVDVIPGTPNY